MNDLIHLKDCKKITQIKISKVSGISAVTIRDRAKEMKKGWEVKFNG